MATNVATTMESVVQDLRLYWGRAYAEASMTWDLFSGGTKAATLALLDKQRGYIDQLEGSLRTRVLAGDATYPFSRWASFAQDVRGAIAQVIGDRSSWSLAGVLSSTVTQTAKDVSKLAQQVPKALEQTPTVLWAIAAALIAYAVISVTRVVR